MNHAGVGAVLRASRGTCQDTCKAWVGVRARHQRNNLAQPSQDRVRPLTRAQLRWADARHRCSNGGGGAGG